MKMKKLLACVLSAGILFSLAACGGNGNGGLSELPTYEQDKEFLIGGWDVPPDTEEAFRIASEMGLGKDTDRNFLQRRLENEINALYDRLTQSLKEENARLSAENSRLKRENEALRRRSTFREI